MKLEIMKAPKKEAIFTALNQPGIFAEADVQGNLNIAGVRYRMSTGGINPTIPVDGSVPIVFEEDGGETYPVRLAKIRSGRIVPDVTDADVVDILARIMRIEESIEELRHMIESMDAKVDNDLLGSIFERGIKP